VFRGDSFKKFVNSLKTQRKLSVTKGNAGSLSSLAKELFLPDLTAECVAFSVQFDPISSLSDRVCKLERQVSLVRRSPAQIEEELESQERGLESLRQGVERQRESLYRKMDRAVPRVDGLDSEFEQLRGKFLAVKDSVGGQIGKLKSETTKVGKSISGLETLRTEFDDLKASVQRLQQTFTRVGSLNPGDSAAGAKQPTQNQFLFNNCQRLLHHRRVQKQFVLFECFLAVCFLRTRKMAEQS
jgi:hypothetical protein